MSIKKLIWIFSLFFVAVCSLSAFSYDFDYEGVVDPDTKKRREDDLAGLIIKTNIEDADVYINGKLFGKTPFATADLSASYYNLEIRKSGYDTIQCRIHLKRHYTYVYNFTLVKTCGYINVTGAPSGSSIYVDGSSHSYFPIETSPGYHTVKVRKFGYEDYSTQVMVENHRTSNISVSLKTAPFEIRDFEVSKTVINPDYNSGIGKANISFYVTNTGSAIVSVNDRYGNMVWSYEYRSFSTWQQSVTWDGCGSEGERLPDGVYTVNLDSLDYEFSKTIKIDRSMIYPLSVPTTSGSGIGTLPCAFSSEMNYVKLYTSFGPMVNAGEKVSLYGVPVNAGLIVDFAKHFELGGYAGMYTAFDKSVVSGSTPVKFGFNFKGSGSIEILSDLSFNFAGLLHYNYCTQYDFIPKNVDMGNGFGFGAAAGLETSMLYFGLSADYSLGKTMNTRNSKRLENGQRANDIIKCGAVASVEPAKNIRTSVWAALHNAEVFEGGLELIMMPAASAFCFDVKTWVLKSLDSAAGKNMLINAQIGLSYLF